MERVDGVNQCRAASRYRRKVQETTGKSKKTESVVAGIKGALWFWIVRPAWTLSLTTSALPAQRLPTAVQRTAPTHFLFGRICLGADHPGGPRTFFRLLSSGRRLSICCRWGQLRRQAHRKKFYESCPNATRISGTLLFKRTSAVS